MKEDPVLSFFGGMVFAAFLVVIAESTFEETTGAYKNGYKAGIEDYRAGKVNANTNVVTNVTFKVKE